MSIRLEHKRMSIQKDTPAKLNGFQFRVEVWEGAPGFADDDDHFGPSHDKCYTDLKTCMKELKEFQPEDHWQHLRSVQQITVSEFKDGAVVKKIDIPWTYDGKRHRELVEPIELTNLVKGVK